MAKETTYAGTLGDWQRLLAPFAANREDLTHLEGSRAKLAALLDQALELNQRQAGHKAAGQEAGRQFRALVPEGRRLANLLRLALKEHYGIRSEKLNEFGMQPFRGRPRKERPAPEESQAAVSGEPDAASPETSGEPAR